MKIVFNQCNLYTLLWCYYYWHSTTFATSDSFTRIMLLISIAWSIYYLIVVNVRYKLPFYLSGMNVLVLMFTIYGIVRYYEGQMFIADGGSIDPLYSLKKIYISILPVYAYYHFTKAGLLNIKLLKVYCIPFLAICFLAYFSYYAKRYGVELDEGVELTNNTGYYFLSLIPIIVIWRDRPILQYAFWGLIMIMLLLCFKRGAIVSGTVCLLAFIFLSIRRSISLRRKITVLFLSIILLYFVINYIEHLFETSDYFRLRFEMSLEGDANGRDIMFPMFWNYLKSSSSLFLLFGGGIDHSIYTFGNYCHNDWFELAICHGLIGFVCYVNYWICFIRNIGIKKRDNMLYTAMILFFLSSFLNTLYSFSFNSLLIFGTSMLGYCLAIERNVVYKKKLNKKNEKNKTFN